MVTTFSICFQKSATSQSVTLLGHRVFFTSPFTFSLYPFFVVQYILCPSETAAWKNKAIALYEQLDDAEAVAELAEAKSQLQKHRLRLKRRSTEAGHDAGNELRWERKIQTAKTRRRPSWTTERWKSDKLAEMDTCFFNSWFREEWWWKEMFLFVEILMTIWRFCWVMNECEMCSSNKCFFAGWTCSSFTAFTTVSKRAPFVWQSLWSPYESNCKSQSYHIYIYIDIEKYVT